MREIKFRGWNGEEMLPLYFNGFINDIFEEKKNIYMQYTGVKDINGREIFEGDVFQYTIEHEFYIPGNGHSITTTKHRAVVEFSLGSFMLGDEYLGDCLEYDDSLEYIGNIYENPELLVTE